MASKITGLVTLHGIGFEQPPQTGVDNSGYADPLRQHLKKCLEEELNDDPHREHGSLDDKDAIYVESRWPDDQGNASREEGMKRLGVRSRSVKQVGQHGQAAPATSPELLAALRNLEDDVACYVCHNEERERVRSFVYEALMRLALREDVDSIVLNTHSNGTVVAFDVLRHLPEEVTSKIKAFVTAGSPLRKYVDLFHWGNQVQSFYPVEAWYNFWVLRDPVADPLNPPLSWRVGDKIVPSDMKLFSRIDLKSETPSWIEVDDHEVDNVEKSRGGGLQAHNFWDNEEQFVKQCCDIVCAIANNHIATVA
jgi:pimeloyl-ACP methyl ester carboxylesterase